MSIRRKQRVKIHRQPNTNMKLITLPSEIAKLLGMAEEEHYSGELTVYEDDNGDIKDEIKVKIVGRAEK